MYDEAQKTAYFWVHDAQALPSWVAAAPFRTLLHWFLSEHDIHLMHGAVVSIGDDAVLLSARGGSGKSTTALACLQSGMTYLGDDYVAVQSGATLHAHSLYHSLKVTPRYMSLFSETLSQPWGNAGDKSIVFVAPLFPQRIRRSATLKAIFVPTIAHASVTRLTPASKAQALLALLPTTLLQLPLAKSGTANQLRDLVLQTPCFTLTLSDDPKEVAVTINQFLA